MRDLRGRLLVAAIVCLSSGAWSQSPPSSVDGARSEPPAVLTAHQQEVLRLRVERLLERDQQFRGYISLGSLSDSLQAHVESLSLQEQLSFRRESDFSEKQEELLWALQKKNDLQNHEEFTQIVAEFGYPSPERIGVEHDAVFALLLHPPFDREGCEVYLEEMSPVLKREVLAGRMAAKSYATFVDNILAKILRRDQLYGTNKVFDSETQQVLPPVIGSLEEANAARAEIGLPMLREGEYRLR